jgi:hypothetical protein
MRGLGLRRLLCARMCRRARAQTEVCATPPPRFFVNTDSKGLNVPRKSFRMNTCRDFPETFILKGLRGQKNR